MEYDKVKTHRAIHRVRVYWTVDVKHYYSLYDIGLFRSLWNPRLIACDKKECRERLRKILMRLRESKRRLVTDYGGKTRVRRIRINNQGYDSKGNYWGVGEFLYEVEDGNIGECFYYRAYSREHAKEKHAKINPDAKYYR